MRAADWPARPTRVVKETAAPVGAAARPPLERPQWEGLFREPDWPPDDEFD